MRGTHWNPALEATLARFVLSHARPNHGSRLHSSCAGHKLGTTLDPSSETPLATFDVSHARPHHGDYGPRFFLAFVQVMTRGRPWTRGRRRLLLHLRFPTLCRYYVKVRAPETALRETALRAVCATSTAYWPHYSALLSVTRLAPSLRSFYQSPASLTRSARSLSRSDADASLPRFARLLVARQLV